MTVDERIATRRAELAERRAGRKDPLDLPGSMTERERGAYADDTAKLDAAIQELEGGGGGLGGVPVPDAEERWRGHLIEWHDMLNAELRAMHPRIRNAKELEQKLGLERSISLIDHGLVSTIGPIVSLSGRLGDLMREAGYATDGPGLRSPNGFRGPLPQTELRVRILTKRRSEAQATLDAALLTDDERSAQDAAHAAQRAVLATMRVKHNRDGDGLVAFTPDGEPLPVDAMTAEQREAFELQQRQVLQQRQPSELQPSELRASELQPSELQQRG